jgi:hypothetical protein
MAAPTAVSRLLAREDLERARDLAFRRAHTRRVESERDALAFVEEVGICSTFYRFPEGVGCLWEAVVGRRDPRWPRRSHHDAGVGLTWELKDRLPARRAVYCGKLLKGRPVLVALDVFPAFYALIRRRHPLYTREWRAEALMLDPDSTRGFERAVAELQQALFAVKTEERYDPSFSYRWDLVEAWLPDAVREGRRLSRPAALRRLVGRYLGGAAWGSVRRIARLFGVPADEVRRAVAALARAGEVERAVPGLPADWVVHRAVRRSAGSGPP